MNDYNAMLVYTIAVIIRGMELSLLSSGAPSRVKTVIHGQVGPLLNRIRTRMHQSLFCHGFIESPPRFYHQKIQDLRVSREDDYNSIVKAIQEKLRDDGARDDTQVEVVFVFFRRTELSGLRNFQEYLRTHKTHWTLSIVNADAALAYFAMSNPVVAENPVVAVERDGWIDFFRKNKNRFEHFDTLRMHDGMIPFKDYDTKRYKDAIYCSLSVSSDELERCTARILWGALRLQQNSS